MPRPSAPPKYRHYKPKNLGVVRIDGRDHYLGKHDSPESWERYHRLLAERASSGGARTGPTAAEAEAFPQTVAELVLAYWRHAEGYYRDPDGGPSRELESLKPSLRPLTQLYGRTSARDFGPVALKAVRQSMIDSGLARTTINYRLGKVVRVFRWAVENELVPPSSHHALQSVAGLRKGRSAAPEPKPVRPVADAEVDAMRPFVARQVWAMIELQRLTAARPGEIVARRTGEIDRTGEIWIYRPRRHKTDHHGHERRIFLGPRAREVLTPFLRDDPDAYIFQPGEAVADQNVARRSVRKTPMTPSQRARQRRARPKRAPGRSTPRTPTARRSGADAIRPAPTLPYHRSEPRTSRPSRLSS